MRPEDRLRRTRRLKALGRYAAGLPGYLRQPLGPAEAWARVRRQLERRESSFLQVMEWGVYGNPRSPYGRLLGHSGIELGDVARLVGEGGVEGALAHLHEAGVHVSIDEFKGRSPIRRPGFELHARAADFDNPLLRRHYEARTGGSKSGVGSRINIDLDLLSHEAAYQAVHLKAFRLDRYPRALWRPTPPGHAGLKEVLREAKIGGAIEAWFSQHAQTVRPSGLPFLIFTAYTIQTCRLCGVPVPTPQHVPVERASTVARWLAAKAEGGTPAALDTPWSSAVRVCSAARAEGLDVAGSFFRVGGEAATGARAAAIESAGGRFAAHYSMGEVGRIGIACSERRTIDEVHVATDKLAVLERPRRIGGQVVGALHLTTLLPSSPKLMLNVDSGDHGTLGRRDCGCPAEELGLSTHLHGIASHEKLTGEGMQFVGSELIRLLDEVLPARFGGGPTDYQLVEAQNSDALTKVSLVVSPRVGPIDERELSRAFLRELAARGEAQRMMVEQWRRAGTLRVDRRDPHVTGGKVQPLRSLPAAPHE